MGRIYVQSSPKVNSELGCSGRIIRDARKGATCGPNQLEI